MDNHLPDTVISLEQKMWDAFRCGDSRAFSSLVLPEAMMVIGGARTTGQFYASAIADVKLNSTHLEGFQVVPLGEDAVLVSYLASVDGGPGCEDLSGVYQVSSVWVRRGDEWKLIFNQDSVAERR